ncbi:MAG: AI-2E family transporter [Blastocatellia bacterium]|nr:AI-2E family transporter [Blastocatellia bacterium]
MEQNANSNRPQRGPLEWMRWVPAALFALAALTLALVGARVILVPALTSLALAYLLAPVVIWFERRGWSRSTSVLLTMTAATLLMVLILIFIVPGFWNQASKSYAQARDILGNPERRELLLRRVEQLNPQLRELLQTQIESYRSGGGLARLGGAAGGWLQRGLFRLVDLTASILDLLLIPFFVFYFLADYEAMRKRVDLMIPPRFRGVTSDLLGQINHVVSSYVRSQLLIALAMGGLYSVGFLALRVPLAITIGMLSGLLNFVPYLGTLLGIVFSLGFAALDGAGAGRLGSVLLVFIIVQSIEGYYLTPKLLGSSLNLHPLWVLVGLMIGGNLFGLLGIILAVPVIAIAKVVIAFLDQLYLQSNFYRAPGVQLLSDQGLPLPPTDAPRDSHLLLDPSTPERPRRAIITTAELRSRIRETPPPTGEE